MPKSPNNQTHRWRGFVIRAQIFQQPNPPLARICNPCPNLPTTNPTAGADLQSVPKSPNNQTHRWRGFIIRAPQTPNNQTHRWRGFIIRAQISQQPIQPLARIYNPCPKTPNNQSNRWRGFIIRAQISQQPIQPLARICNPCPNLPTTNPTAGADLQSVPQISQQPIQPLARICNPCPQNPYKKINYYPQSNQIH